jgi:excisionase family DNA binding protein
MTHNYSLRKELKLPAGKISLAGAAEYLEVSRQKVSRLLKKGVLTGAKFELDERIVLLDVEELKRLKGHA